MKTLIIFFLFLSSILQGATYYVATNGNDSNAGTLASPFKTIQIGVNKLSAGDILYIRAGTYQPAGTLGNGFYNGIYVQSKVGSAGKEIQILAYPGESVIIDGTLMSQAAPKAGFQISYSSYIKIKGLTIQNVLEKSAGSGEAESFYGESSSYITIEQCVVTRCGNGYRLAGNCDYISYINCDAYDCWDIGGTTTSGGPGGYCNGFNGNYNAGKHNTLIGCRAWLCTDDGYDNMAGGGYITYTNCWAFLNGHTSVNSVTGDGDGFKLGFTDKGNESGTQRILYNCISAYNDLMGFDESMDIATNMNMILYNCISYGNKDAGFRFYQPLGTGVATLKNNVSYLSAANRDYEGRSRNVQDHNSWNGGVTVSNADFISIAVSELSKARKPDGSLPDISFLNLVSGSDLIDKGVNVGLAYNGTAPDLGAFESGSVVITPPHSTLGKRIMSNGKRVKR